MCDKAHLIRAPVYSIAGDFKNSAITLRGNKISTNPQNNSTPSAPKRLSYDQKTIYSAAKIFGDLVVQILVHGVNYESYNKKEGAALALALYSLLWVEVTIYPLAPIQSGDGSINSAESIACDMKCANSHEGRKSQKKGQKAPRCYVRALSLRDWQAKALTQLETGETVSLPQNGYIIRLTRWGDISRLNNEGLRYIYDLCAKAHTTRAYSNIWRHELDAPNGDPERALMISLLKGYFQASVATPEEAIKAARVGWRVYASHNHQAIRAALKEHEGEASYRCPANYTTRFCSNCSIPCNGTRHILSP